MIYTKVAFSLNENPALNGSFAAWTIHVQKQPMTVGRWPIEITVGGQNIKKAKATRMEIFFHSNEFVNRIVTVTKIDQRNSRLEFLVQKFATESIGCDTHDKIS